MDAETLRMFYELYPQSQTTPEMRNESIRDTMTPPAPTVKLEHERQFKPFEEEQNGVSSYH